MIIKNNQRQLKTIKTIKKQSKKLKCNQKIIIKIKTKSKHKMEKEVGDVHENYEN